MVAQEGAPEPAHDLDDLRRRLYRPDAAEADVRRYLAERGEQADTVGEAPEQPAPRTSSRRRVAVAGLAAVAAVAALTTAVQHDSSRRSSEAPPTARAQPDGEGLEIRQGAVSRPVDAATSVQGVAVTGQRFTGHGNVVVRLDPPAGAAPGGRAMVVVTSGVSSPVSWRALLRQRPAGATTSRLQVLAVGRTRAPGGVAGPVVFDLPSGPPDGIEVEAPDDAAWTLLVAVTDRSAKGPAPE